MPMAAKGLAKLVEELGELQQAVGKKLAYYHTDDHPDGGPPLSDRLHDEMGDVLAAIWMTAGLLGLDIVRIQERKRKKMALFQRWHAQEDNNLDAVDAVPPPRRTDP